MTGLTALAHELSDYTEQLVFSFVDIAEYVKISRSLFRGGFQFIDFDQGLMAEMASALPQSANNTSFAFRPVAKRQSVRNGHLAQSLYRRSADCPLFSDDNSLMDYVGRGELLFRGKFQLSNQG